MVGPINLDALDGLLQLDDFVAYKDSLFTRLMTINYVRKTIPSFDNTQDESPLSACKKCGIMIMLHDLDNNEEFICPQKVK
jgi:hypothetical protein